MFLVWHGETDWNCERGWLWAMGQQCASAVLGVQVCRSRECGNSLNRMTPSTLFVWEVDGYWI
jgi:hypothetical protein